MRSVVVWFVGRFVVGLRGFVAVLAVVLASASCGETPAQGFEKFYAALADGSDDAYGRLSTAAQAQFAGAARAKGLEPAKLLASAVPKTTVRSVDVVSQSKDTAVVEVKDALGRSQRVHMLRENGTWRVDLSP